MADSDAPGGEQHAEGDHNLQINRSPFAQISVTYAGTKRNLPLHPAVLPVDAKAQPSRLVQARSRLVPYTARPETLTELKAWLTSPEPFRFQVIGGRGGSGKTRAGVELAAWSDEQPTTRISGLLMTGADGGEIDELLAAPCARLVVIDYAETRLSQLGTLLPRLANHASEAHPVRVLLLVRDRPHDGDDLRALLRDHSDDLDAIIDQVELEELEDPPLAQRQALFTAAAGAFIEHHGLDGPAPPPPAALGGDAFARPLLVTIAAYLTAHDPGSVPETRDGLLKGILAHEARHWEHTAAAAGLELDKVVRKRVVAMATLAGAVSEADAVAMLRHIPDLTDANNERLLTIARWVRGLYPGLRYWNPLEPDLLGEYLVATEWADHPEVIAGALTDRTADAMRQPLELLARAAIDRPDFADALTPVISARLEDLVQAAIEQAGTQAGYEAYFSGTTLASAVDRLVQVVHPHPGSLARALLSFPSRPDLVFSPLRITLLEQTIEHLRTDPTGDAALAGLLNDLTNELNAVGRLTEATDAIEEAVALRRKLAQSDPASHTHHLATSLNNLSNQLDADGRLAEALDAIEEAVGLDRGLAAADPDRYTGRLASSLNNLSTQLASCGRRVEALEIIEEATAIYRTLVDQDPVRYTAELAACLNNLAMQSSANDRQGAGLVAIEEAASIYRRLAESNPAAYTPNLTALLTNMSALLAGEGRFAEGLAAIQESVRLRRQLAEANPTAHTADLAGSLNNLSLRLTALGLGDDALVAIEEAVDLRRRLAIANPGAFIPDLATSLHNLSSQHAMRGDDGAAIEAIEEAIALRRALAQADLAAFGQGLAGSLRVAGMQLAKQGRLPEALMAVEEAATVYRALMAFDAAAAAPPLARMLDLVATYLEVLGRGEEALAASEEAVAILRDLASAEPKHRGDLAAVLNNLSTILAAAGPDDAARRHIDEAIAIFRGLAVTHPSQSDHGLVVTLTNLANQLEEAGRAEEASGVRAEAEAAQSRLLGDP